MTVEGRALRRAVELAGSRENLAKRIGARIEELDKWLAGTGRPPREIFLRVVDVILDDSPAPSASSEPPDSPPGQSATPVDAND
jgi:hypothetical protein